MDLWTALVLGFVGSFHCVGMCGPLAMSLPRTSSRFLLLSLNALVYNSGRVATYSIFGFFFGLLGTQITISGFQGWLSIILGISIVSSVFVTRFFKTHNRPPLYKKLSEYITIYYGILMRKTSFSALFGMGLLNGLLPCAFVYSGLAVAVLTPSPYHSMVYMALFGLGTFPAMYFMYLAPSILSLDLRNSIRKFIPYLAFSLGVFLIVRGVALQDLSLSRVLAENIDSFCIFPGTETN
ncbi:MAG: sulfite exporter TauE/SafE family protein [Balneolaceae bacterium]